MREVPYRPDGRDYVCGLCSEPIPDGAHVLGVWLGEVLQGVRVEDSDGAQVHACGVPVAGADLTPEQRVEARGQGDYAAETGH